MPHVPTGQILQNSKVHKVPIAPDGFRVEYNLRSNSKLSQRYATDSSPETNFKPDEQSKSLYIEFSD